jgi:hypothetical protein
MINTPPQAMVSPMSEEIYQRIWRMAVQPPVDSASEQQWETLTKSEERREGRFACPLSLKYLASKKLSYGIIAGFEINQVYAAGDDSTGAGRSRTDPLPQLQR